MSATLFRRMLPGLTGAISLTLMACSAPAPIIPAGTTWSYEGFGAPDFWGHLTAEYAACRTGSTQTPVNLAGAVSDNALQPLTFAWKAGAAEMEDNGHSVQINVPDGGTLSVGGSVYTLKQYHFHAPAEHTVNGRIFPLEIHFVHEDAAKRLAVVGLLAERGAANPAFDDWVKALPIETKTKKSLATQNPQAMLPQDLGYYRYEGSLTTPPCSEAVRWQVLRQPVTLSGEQINAFTNLYDHNARPVQPLNGRTIAML